ncbi:MAG: hypothetical protein H8K03_18900 [Nitrospira sp.]
MTRIPLSPEVRFLRIPTKWEMDFDKKGAPQVVRPTLLDAVAGNLDGWEIRNRFLRLRHTESAALDFLHDIGIWDTYALSDRRRLMPTSVFLDGPLGLWDLQERWRRRLATPKRLKSLFTPPTTENRLDASDPFFELSFGNPFFELTFRVEWQANQPIGVIETISGIQLLKATLLIDLMRCANFRICARPDCGIPFSVTSNHEKKYCEWYCGHIESVRRRREEGRHQRKDPRDGKKRRSR